MKLHALLDVLEQASPLSLAESWDHVGLQISQDDRNVRRAMLCIDLTEPVLAEAIERKVTLVVAYHPPIFQPLTALTDATAKQRLIRRAIRKRIAIYSPHTALDAVAGGVTDWLAQALGPGSATTISPGSPDSPGYKLVTFIPHRHAERVRDAMFEAGAGTIGDYSHCSFTHPGTGTFKGGDTTQPFIGHPGQLESVDELRLEMACRPDRLSQAIAALHQSHPYEEPAYDVLRLEAAAPGSSGDISKSQLPRAGRIWTLERATSVATLTERIKRYLKVKHLDVADAAKPIQRIAVCPGAGGSLLMEVQRVDAYLTGEMRHHDVLEARSRQVSVFLPGHTQTERPYLPVYRKRLIEAGGQGVEWIISRVDSAPSIIR